MEQNSTSNSQSSVERHCDPGLLGAAQPRWSVLPIRNHQDPQRNIDLLDIIRIRWNRLRQHHHHPVALILCHSMIESIIAGDGSPRFSYPPQFASWLCTGSENDGRGTASFAFKKARPFNKHDNNR